MLTYAIEQHTFDTIQEAIKFIQDYCVDNGWILDSAFQHPNRVNVTIKKEKP